MSKEMDFDVMVIYKDSQGKWNAIAHDSHNYNDINVDIVDKEPNITFYANAEKIDCICNTKCEISFDTPFIGFTEDNKQLAWVANTMKRLLNKVLIK